MKRLGELGKFIKSLAIFLIALLPVLIVSDYIYSRFFRDWNDANMPIWKDVMEGEASASLLVSGDSRANTDCYPPVIDSITGMRSYTLGVIGHHFSVQKLRYDMYRRCNEKPEVVVQLVDSWFFDGISMYDRAQFLPWMWNGAFLKGLLSLEPRTFVTKLIPWFRYHGKHLCENKPSIKTERGFITYKPKKVQKYSEESMGFRENPRNEKMFREYLTGLSNDGIKVVFVLAPIYGSLSYKESTLQGTRDYFNSVAREYGIPVLDYLQRPSFEDSTLFMDSVHLNEKGARVFSDSLANDIVSLGLISN